MYPLHWGKNMSGMQAKEEHNALVRSGDGFLIYREDAWWEAMSNAINTARAFADAGYHKQIVNRLLEPFAHINVVVTATEWSNFFALRRHEDAEPHIKLLAYRMWEAMKHSVPAEIDTLKWHLPYITAEDIWMLKDDPTLSSKLIKISVARCARVSYFTHDGKTSHIDKDLELYDRLVGAEPLHASPAEHQATPATDPKVWSGNFRGWIQYRKGLIGECQ